MFSLFQASAHLDLGVRAGQKLREMARREEEEEVKTKVRQIHEIYINYSSNSFYSALVSQTSLVTLSLLDRR